MAKDTREQLLDTAEALFADRGFYGVSIAAIADELGLTKQALLHHFGQKEKLYGEVLARISTGFDGLSAEAMQAEDDPVERLIVFFQALHAPSPEKTAQTRLLMRELLDNKQRADNAATWYLAPFLRRLIGMVQAVPNWQEADDTQSLTLVYQWLGAVNYFAISGPTLAAIFGTAQVADMQARFPEHLAQLIRAGLAMR